MLIFVILFIFIAIYNFYWKRRSLPPGPTPWPLFGNIIELENNSPSYDVFQKWSKHYGPVYTYWIGEIPFIAVTDFDIIKNSFIKDGDSYAGRDFFNAGFHYLSDYTNGVQGVIRTEGEEWRQMRRFTLQAFRDLGMGRKEMQQTILIEVDSMINSINKQINNHLKEHDLMSIIDISVGSVITQVMFGFRFAGKTVADFYALKDVINSEMLMTSKCFSKLVLLMPWLRHFPVFSTNFFQFDTLVSRQFAFFDQQITSRIKARQFERCDSENYVDAFLHKINMNEQNKAEGLDKKYFSISALRAICFEIYGAGQETTSNTLNFLILYLMLNEDVQSKMQNELDKVIGHDRRRILISDRNQLPYSNAVINESQRLANLLPQNLPHRTTKDVELYGFKIAKGTRIVPQISTVLYNDEIFDDPKKFIPERFLDDLGELKKIEAFVPFSIGKRQCLGESLARMELFLFTTNLFYNFRIRMCDYNNPPSLDKITGTTVCPVHYKCRIEERI